MFTYCIKNMKKMIEMLFSLAMCGNIVSEGNIKLIFDKAQG